jgi:hypothetical protein
LYFNFTMMGPSLGWMSEPRNQGSQME